jgi:hypothetical protein
MAQNEDDGEGMWTGRSGGLSGIDAAGKGQLAGHRHYVTPPKPQHISHCTDICFCTQATDCQRTSAAGAGAAARLARAATSSTAWASSCETGEISLRGFSLLAGADSVATAFTAEEVLATAGRRSMPAKAVKAASTWSLPLGRAVGRKGAKAWLPPGATLAVFNVIRIFRLSRQEWKQKSPDAT